MHPLRQVIVSAESVEKAVDEALVQLHTTRDKVKVTVLDTPRKGLFGFFAREARVQVERMTDPVDEAVQFLRNVIRTMHVSAEVEVVSRDPILLNLKGEEIGLLIGRHGQTLDALQYLTSVVANRHSDRYTRLILDAEGYRERRQKALQDLSSRLARKVLSTGKKVVLEPMPPAERKIIHLYIKDIDGLTTQSEGVEPNRRVTILPISTPNSTKENE